jgi:hypothetical protein
MAIGKRPTQTPKVINLETPEVENFVNNGLKPEPLQTVNENHDEELAPVVEEVKRGRKKSVDTQKVKFYNLPIPEELFDGIEDYIYQNRKIKKITIRGFIVDCIRKELKKENIIQ